MKSVFLSHSFEPATIAFVARLVDELQRLGFSVANDYYSRHQEAAIAIRRSNVVVGVVTDRSPHVFFEIGCAVGANRKVMLVTSPSVDLPFELKSFRNVKAGELDSEALFQIASVLQEFDDESPIAANELSGFRDILKSYEADPIYFESLSGTEFERSLFEYFEALGFEPAMLHQNADAGYDFELHGYHGYRKTFVDIKKYSANSRVSVGNVQRLLGVVAGYRADHGILISTSQFTRSAIDFAEKCNPRIELWGMSKVLEML